MITREINPNRPMSTLTDRPLKVTIWEREGEGGKAEYNVLFTRTVRAESGFKETHGIRRGDLLALARLANRAYDMISSLENALANIERSEGGAGASGLSVVDPDVN